jgi:alpha-D-xyloside xylohydrolase
VYRGADGNFDLYDDAGDSYDYEKGQHTVIPIRWDQSAGTLTIGERQGSFPGMVEKRTFRIVVVGNGHGVGGDITGNPDKEITYEGKGIVVQLAR